MTASSRLSGYSIHLSPQIERILRSQTSPTNLFRFIVNPGDFGQTVENLFYISFLIREGKCAFEFTEDTQEPIICIKPSLFSAGPCQPWLTRTFCLQILARLLLKKITTTVHGNNKSSWSWIWKRGRWAFTTLLSSDHLLNGMISCSER